jgi:hypothetical protein
MRTTPQRCRSCWYATCREETAVLPPRGPDRLLFTARVVSSGPPTADESIRSFALESA